MEKDGFVYIWYDRKRKMYYIGSHWGGHIDDGYICSSNRMRDAYRRRPDDFRRRILNQQKGTRKSLLEKEEEWLFLAKKRKNRYYNYRFNAIVTEYTRKNKRHLNIWNKGIPHSEAVKQKMREAWIERKKVPFSNETKQKMSKSRKGKPIPKMQGRKLSEEHKQKIRESLIGRRKKYYGEDDY